VLFKEEARRRAMNFARLPEDARRAAEAKAAEVNKRFADANVAKSVPGNKISCQSHHPQPRVETLFISARSAKLAPRCLLGS
jgi:hypothetical protein